PGYSAAEVTKPNYLTWAILKAHTQNRAGEVVLRSADPQDTPLINFHYFAEGSDTAGEDMQSVVAGIRFVRQLTAKLKAQGLIALRPMRRLVGNRHDDAMTAASEPIRARGDNPHGKVVTRRSRRAVAKGLADIARAAIIGIAAAGFLATLMAVSSAVAEERSDCAAAPPV